MDENMMEGTIVEPSHMMGIVSDSLHVLTIPNKRISTAVFGPLFLSGRTGI